MGLDVHDDCPYSLDAEEIKFEKGMVMTIEPGIYVNETAEVDDKWKGIGIRIEDDVLVRGKNPEVLSIAALKEISDIEF